MRPPGLSYDWQVEEARKELDRRWHEARTRPRAPDPREPVEPEQSAPLMATADPHPLRTPVPVAPRREPVPPQPPPVRRPAVRFEQATVFLRAFLVTGPVPAVEAIQAARLAGISERTLYRAMADLKVKSDREGRPGDPRCKRFWRLPRIRMCRPKGPRNR